MSFVRREEKKIDFLTQLLTYIFLYERVIMLMEKNKSCAFDDGERKKK